MYDVAKSLALNIRIAANTIMGGGGGFAREIRVRAMLSGGRYRAAINTLDSGSIEIRITTSGIFKRQLKKILIHEDGQIEYISDRDGTMKFELDKKTVGMLSDAHKSREAFVSILDVLYTQFESLVNQANDDGTSNLITFEDRKEARHGYTIRQVKVSDDLNLVDAIRRDFVFSGARSMLKNIASAVKA